MELTVFLKMLYDGAIILSMAGFGVSLLLPVGPLTAALLFPALAAGASYLLYKNGKNRWLGLLLALPMLLFAGQKGDWIVLGILLAYLCYIVKKQYFRNDSGDFKDSFAKSFFLCCLPALFSALTFDFEPLNNFLLPDLLIIAVSAIALLRILRHSTETIESGAFKLSNILTVTLVCLVTLVLSTDIIVDSVTGALAWFYNTFLVDLLYGIIFGVAQFLSLFSKFFAWLFGKEVVFYEDGDKAAVGTAEDMLYDEVINEIPPWVTWVVVGLLAAGFVYLLLKGLKALAGRNRRFEADNPFDLTREAIEVPKEARRNPFTKRSPQESVRHQYRKFLRECLDRGFRIPPHFDTKQIARNAEDYFVLAPLEPLRQIYIKARYTDREISKEEAAQAKKLFGEIKKAGAFEREKK